jgi:hypothetical protein
MVRIFCDIERVRSESIADNLLSLLIGQCGSRCAISSHSFVLPK